MVAWSRNRVIGPREWFGTKLYECQALFCTRLPDADCHHVIGSNFRSGLRLNTNRCCYKRLGSKRPCKWELNAVRASSNGIFECLYGAAAMHWYNHRARFCMLIGRRVLGPLSAGLAFQGQRLIVSAVVVVGMMDWSGTLS